MPDEPADPSATIPWPTVQGRGQGVGVEGVVFKEGVVVHKQDRYVHNI